MCHILMRLVSVSKLTKEMQFVIKKYPVDQKAKQRQGLGWAVITPQQGLFFHYQDCHYCPKYLLELECR